MTEDGPSHLKRNIEILLLVMLAASIMGTAFFMWVRGSQRAGCIMNIRNVQQAMRGHQGVNGMRIGDPVAFSDIVGPGKYLYKVECPAGGTYKFLGRHPKLGELALECSLCNEPHRHIPDKYSDW